MFLAALAALVLNAPPSIDGAVPKEQPAPNDLALVVGISDYAFAPDVPYADTDARAFYRFLTESRGLPPERVRFLLNDKAAREDIEAGVQFLLSNAAPESTLWVYFAGHGLPSPSGGDGLLAGMDAKQTEASVQTRSVSREWLVGQLAASRAQRAVVVLDACFSGKTRDGQQLLAGQRPLLAVKRAPESAGNKVLIFSAALGDETSGPFDAAAHGLFSYFAIGGLRGWADADADGVVTGRELAVYTQRGAHAVLSDGSRSQTPDVNAEAGDARLDWALAASAPEHGPDLAMLAPALAHGGGRVEVATSTKLQDVPALAGNLKSAGAIDLGVDVAVLKAYEGAIKADRLGKQAPDDAAQKWELLASIEGNNPWRSDAISRSRQWRDFDAKRRAFAIQREADTLRLKEVLPLTVVEKEQKTHLLRSYADLYGDDAAVELLSGVEPDTRSALCPGAIDYAKITSGRQLVIDMPLVSQKHRTGKVTVDGHPVGATPGPLTVPRCANQVEVRDEAGAVWTAAIGGTTGDRVELSPSFKGVVTDWERDRPSREFWNGWNGFWSATGEALTQNPTAKYLWVSGEALGIDNPLLVRQPPLRFSAGMPFLEDHMSGELGGILSGEFDATVNFDTLIFLDLLFDTKKPLRVAFGPVEWKPLTIGMRYGYLFNPVPPFGFPPGLYMAAVPSSVLRIRMGPVGVRVAANAILYLPLGDGDVGYMATVSAGLEWNLCDREDGCH